MRWHHSSGPGLGWLARAWSPSTHMFCSTEAVETMSFCSVYLPSLDRKESQSKDHIGVWEKPAPDWNFTMGNLHITNGEVIFSIHRSFLRTLLFVLMVWNSTLPWWFVELGFMSCGNREDTRVILPVTWLNWWPGSLPSCLRGLECTECRGNVLIFYARSHQWRVLSVNSF